MLSRLLRVCVGSAHPDLEQVRRPGKAIALAADPDDCQEDRRSSHDPDRSLVGRLHADADQREAAAALSQARGRNQRPRFQGPIVVQVRPYARAPSMVGTT